MARLQLNLPRLKSASAGLAVTMVVASVVVAVFPILAPFIVLVPGAVLSSYFLWVPLTYGFIEGSPMGVIFGAIILYSIGGALEYSWGRRKLLTFAIAVTTLAGVATVLLSLIWPALQSAIFVGGGAMAGSLWVAYGLANGSRQINFWGLPVTGNVFALIGAAFVGLNAAFAGAGSVVPDAFALAFTFLASRGVSPGPLWERFRSWQLDRTLKRRSSKLQVIAGDKRNMPRDSDRFLH